MITDFYVNLMKKKKKKQGGCSLWTAFNGTSRNKKLI